MGGLLTKSAKQNCNESVIPKPHLPPPPMPPREIMPKNESVIPKPPPLPPPMPPRERMPKKVSLKEQGEKFVQLFSQDASAVASQRDADIGKMAHWAVEALKQAHMDSDLKWLGRELLSKWHFTVLYGPKVFSQMRNSLHAYLQQLGEGLEKIYCDQKLDEIFGDAAIAAAGIAPHPQFSDKMGSISQTMMIPIDPDYFDFGDLLRSDEKVYLHVILMVGAAIDALFHDRVRECVGADGTLHAAPTKSYVRAKNKMASKDDYRYKLKPRGAYNVDIDRNLVQVHSVDQFLHVTKKIVDACGGFARMKNMFCYSFKERQERYHLLSLMLTLPFSPGDMTYRALCASACAQTAFQAYIHAADHGGEPIERWNDQTRRALAYIHGEFLAEKQVTLFCEVQMMLSAHYAVRCKSHEPYKVVRAVDPTQLHRDFARSQGNLINSPSDILVASTDLALAKQLFRGVIDGDDETTPLLKAAEEEHLEIVAWLLELGANPNKAVRSGATPLGAAVSFGFHPIVAILIKGGADVNMVVGAHSPLMLACITQFLDIAQLLVCSDANVNYAIPDDGLTALCYACNYESLPIVEFLIEAAADVNVAPEIDGITPLHAAGSTGNSAMVALLIKNKASVTNRCLEGYTPLQLAAQSGDNKPVQRGA